MISFLSRRLTFLLISSLLALFIGCSKDDGDTVESNTENSSVIFNKWWFDSEDFTADVFFNSNGEYQQRINISGFNIDGSGDWKWIDENKGLMEISNLSGQGQIISNSIYKFSNIKQNSFELEISLDNGESFLQKVIYEDVD